MSLVSYNYSFHNDTYLVPLAPDDLLQADAKMHYIYTRERRACQRNNEALHSPKLKSVWTAVPRRQNILHLFTDTTRFTKRLTIVSFSEFSGSSNNNCVRDDRTKVSRKLKSCRHEDREDSASPFFCFQCCSSPVHWQIFQSHRTKKRIYFSLPKTTNILRDCPRPAVFIMYID